MLSVLVVGILQGEDTPATHEAYWNRMRWSSPRLNASGNPSTITKVTFWGEMPEGPEAIEANGETLLLRRAAGGDWAAMGAVESYFRACQERLCALELAPVDPETLGACVDAVVTVVKDLRENLAGDREVATEMLAALKAICAYDLRLPEGLRPQAEAAIARAEGRAQ